VLALVSEHAPEVSHEMLSTRSSRGGRYLAVTVHLRAQSRAQLDRIYEDLSAHKRVLAAL
jgi:putative lipoic acid-binding regulatory protein